MQGILNYLKSATLYNDNSLLTWLLALLVAGISLAALVLARRIALDRFQAFARRTRIPWDDLVLELIRKTKSFLPIVLGLFIGSRVLDLRPDHRGIVNSAAILALLLQGAFWGGEVIAFWLRKYKATERPEDAAAATTMALLGFIARLALWTILVLLALQNLGIDVTALIAGLSISSIAVAFAVQNILKDLFSSFSIIFDKPFVLGDFLIVGDHLGTVERIGLKTTRLRSLSGEQLIFSNSDLLESRIRNFKRMFERRATFTIGVTYQTPHAKLEAIPKMLREVIEGRQQVRFDRAHFTRYGDFALLFEAVYYVLVPEMNTYLDIQQSINLEIHKRFEAEGIEFAYPTQTLFLQQEAAAAPPKGGSRPRARSSRGSGS